MDLRLIPIAFLLLIAAWLGGGHFGDIRGAARVQAEWDQQTQARERVAAADEIKTGGKEREHAAATQGASDAFTQTAPAREDALRADLARAERLRRGAEQRAAGYRAQAEAGAAACRRLADRYATIDAHLVEGVDVVADLRAAVDRRDAEVALLRRQIDADRALLAP